MRERVCAEGWLKGWPEGWREGWLTGFEDDDTPWRVSQEKQRWWEGWFASPGEMFRQAGRRLGRLGCPCGPDKGDCIREEEGSWTKRYAS